MEEEYKELEQVADDPLRQNELVKELSTDIQRQIEKEGGQLVEKRLEYEKELVDFNIKFDEQIEKHIN